MNWTSNLFPSADHPGTPFLFAEEFLSTGADGPDTTALESGDRPYVRLSGSWDARFETACRAIDERFFPTPDTP